MSPRKPNIIFPKSKYLQSANSRATSKGNSNKENEIKVESTVFKTSTPDKAQSPKTSKAQLPGNSWDVSTIADIVSGPARGSIKSDIKTQDPTIFKPVDGDVGIEHNKMRIAAVLNYFVNRNHAEVMKNINSQIESLQEKVIDNRKLCNEATQIIEAVRSSNEREQVEKSNAAFLKDSNLDSSEITQCGQHLEDVSNDVRRVKSSLELLNFAESIDGIGHCLKEIEDVLMNMTYDVSFLREPNIDLSCDLTNLSTFTKHLRMKGTKSTKLMSRLQALAIHEASLKTSVTQTQDGSSSLHHF